MNVGFLIFIGLPGSGKTTLAEGLKNSYNNRLDSEFYFIHVCYDELIPPKPIKSEWRLLRNSLVLEIEKLVKAVKYNNKDICPPMFAELLKNIISLHSKIILIVDDNMYFKSMRYTLYQIAKNHKMGFCQVFIQCPLEEALDKNAKRQGDSKVPNGIIEIMADKIEPPNHRNNWEKFSLIIDAFCDINEFSLKLFPILNNSLENCQYNTSCDNEQKELSALECKKNILHQADLTLRKIIGTKMKEHIATNDVLNSKAIISQLKNRKSEILNDLRQGYLCIPDDILQDIKDGQQSKSGLFNYLIGYF